MSLPTPVDRLGPEFATFLRSPLWEERTGGTLSLLSAFARLDLDPWQEAASLAALSREAAARRLGQILARLPGSASEGAFESMCARSVGLLPSVGAPRAPMPARALAPAEVAPSRQLSGIQFALLAAWMVTLSLLAGQFAGRPTGPLAPAPAAAGPGPGPTGSSATGPPARPPVRAAP